MSRLAGTTTLFSLLVLLLSTSSYHTVYGQHEVTVTNAGLAAGANITTVATSKETMGRIVIGSASTANTVYAMKGGITNGIVSVDLTKSPPSVVEDKVGWVQSGGGIGMSTDGTTLYVADSFSVVREVPPAKWEDQKTFVGIGSTIIDIAVSSSFLFAMTSSQVYKVTLPKSDGPKEFPSSNAFSTPQAVSISADGQTLYVLDSKALHEVDVGTSAVTQLSTAVAGFDHLSVATNGKIYVGNSKSGGVVTVNQVTGAMNDLVAANGIAGMAGLYADPANPDNLYVTSTSSNQYNLLLVDGGSAGGSSPTPSPQLSPGVSPTPQLSPGVSPSPGPPGNGSSPLPSPSGSPTPQGSPKPHKVNGFIEFFDEHAWAVYTIVGIAGAAILASAILLLLRRLQRKKAERAPLLPQSNHDVGSGGSGSGGGGGGSTSKGPPAGLGDDYGDYSFVEPGRRSISHSHTSRGTSPPGDSVRGGRRGSRTARPPSPTGSDISQTPSERRRKKKRRSTRSGKV